jgi:hypothetical protein
MIVRQGRTGERGEEAHREDQGDNALCRFTHFEKSFLLLIWVALCHAYGLFSSHAAIRFTWNHLLCVLVEHIALY